MSKKDEWISASEVSKRLKAKAGIEVTKFNIGKVSSKGHLTRRDNKKTGRPEYPWPKALKEYKKYNETKRNKIEGANNSKNIVVKQEDIKDTYTSDRILAVLEEGISGAETKAYQWARSVRELIALKKDQLNLLVLEGKTINREEVEDYIFSISRQNRDSWLNWPQIVATEMAEELEVDGKLMNDILIKCVRKNLERIATMPVDFERYSPNSISKGTRASVKS